MLVHLRQYREDDATEPLRSDGTDSPDRDEEDYFDIEELEADEGWERTEVDDRTLLARPVSFDDATAVSVPRDDGPSGPGDMPDEEDDDLPGTTLMIRTQGGEKFVRNAEIVEVQDASP